MQILTNNKVVFAIGETIEFGQWENDPMTDTYRIKNGDNYQYAVVADFVVHAVDAVPDDYEPNKYCYDDGFTLNPDWKPQEQQYTLDEAAELLAQEVSES